MFCGSDHHRMVAGQLVTPIIDALDCITQHTQVNIDCGRGLPLVIDLYCDDIPFVQREDSHAYSVSVECHQTVCNRQVLAEPCPRKYVFSCIRTMDVHIAAATSVIAVGLREADRRGIAGKHIDPVDLKPDG